MHRALDPAWNWTQTDELLASLIEVIDAGNRMFVAAHSKKGARQPKPIRVPRPNDEKQSRSFLELVDRHG